MARDIHIDAHGEVLPRRIAVEIVTDAAGDAIDYSAHFSGVIHSIWLENTDLASGTFDLTLTLEDSGEGVLTEANITCAAGSKIARYPRTEAHDTADGSEHTGAGEIVPIVAVNDRLKVVTADGGDTKSATLYINVL